MYAMTFREKTLQDVGDRIRFFSDDHISAQHEQEMLSRAQGAAAAGAAASQHGPTPPPLAKADPSLKKSEEEKTEGEKKTEDIKKE